MEPSTADSDFLHERLVAIGEGLKEGVRREVRRLRQLGLPIYVADNGRVVDRQTTPHSRREPS